MVIQAHYNVENPVFALNLVFKQVKIDARCIVYFVWYGIETYVLLIPSYVLLIELYICIQMTWFCTASILSIVSLVFNIIAKRMPNYINDIYIYLFMKVNWTYNVHFKSVKLKCVHWTHCILQMNSSTETVVCTRHTAIKIATSIVFCIKHFFKNDTFSQLNPVRPKENARLNINFCYHIKIYILFCTF